MIKKVHYINLNPLRFIAAFIVIIHHTEQVKSIKGLPNIWSNNVVVPMLGKLGVDIFFVLSGFLITSLLFIESETEKGINIKNFIIRRLLRIWPLYFIIVILGFFIMPHIASLQLGRPFISIHKHFIVNLIMFVLFLPHVASIVIGPLLYASQAWSIGIEEQFYLIWPFLVKKLSVKKIVVFTSVFILLYLIFCAGLSFVSHNIYNKPGDIHSLIAANLLVLFQDILKFDCLLIGGLFAILNNYITADSFFRSKIFQLSCYLIEIVLVCFGWQFYGVLFWEVHAVIFGFIILNLIHEDTSIINLEYPWLGYLGKISYGLYMYHFLIINIVVTLFYKIGLPYMVYPVIFAGTIMLASLSYRYFESYFLKKKTNYSSIKTG